MSFPIKNLSKQKMIVSALVLLIFCLVIDAAGRDFYKILGVKRNASQKVSGGGREWRDVRNRQLEIAVWHFGLALTSFAQEIRKAARKLQVSCETAVIQD
jgi:hypothetical protein